MLSYPSPSFLALANQRLAVDQVCPDGPIAGRRTAPAGRPQPVASGRRWWFRSLRARTA